MLLVRRCFATSLKTPWVFRGKHFPEAEVQFDLASQDKLLKFTQAQFTKSFQSLCEGFAKNDKLALQRILEPTLYKAVSQNLDELKAENYQFQFLGIENLEITPINYEMFIGVHIDRNLNGPEASYMEISNLEQIRGSISKDDILKEAENDGVELSDDILQSKLDNIWMYISPKAPASLVMRLNTIFKLTNPLTLIKDGKDVVYERREEEIHALRMENLVSVVGKDQEEAFYNGNFEQLMSPLLKLEERTLSKPWTIVDVDNIMNGNPHVQRTQAKLIQ